MKARAIKDLTQLADPLFFAAISEGLGLIAKNVARLWDAASMLGENARSHAASVLTVIAEEEAAKYLILMDAVRCPRQPADRLVRQLARFNDHLAKGIYARSCWMRPATLAELQEYVNTHRHDFYLDGPNDVDWIFRNEVIQRREGTFYVDYVAHDEGHQWSDPAAFEDIGVTTVEPPSVTMAHRLHDSGVADSRALAVIAELWRASAPGSSAHCQDIRRLNLRTLQALEERSLLIQQPSDRYASIVNDWQFPMYDLDLSSIKVDTEALRERQRNWNPGWY